LLVVVKILNHLDIVEHKKGSWVRAVVEMAGFGDELVGKVNQKLYTTLRDKLSDKLTSSGVDCFLDGGCCSPSEVALFVFATDLNQKTLSEKKGKLVGFLATKMVTKNFKVNTVENMLLKKIPGKVSEALQSTGVEHELTVKLVKVYSSEEVEGKVATDMEQVTADYENKSFLERYSRSVICVFFNTTGYSLKLESATLTLGKSKKKKRKRSTFVVISLGLLFFKKVPGPRSSCTLPISLGQSALESGRQCLTSILPECWESACTGWSARSLSRGRARARRMTGWRSLATLPSSSHG